MIRITDCNRQMSLVAIQINYGCTSIKYIEKNPVKEEEIQKLIESTK